MLGTMSLYIVIPGNSLKHWTEDEKIEIENVTGMSCLGSGLFLDDVLLLRMKTCCEKRERGKDFCLPLKP